MSNKVSIKELMECVELSMGELDEFSEYHNYINVKTGKIVSVPARFIGMAEDGEEPEGLADWEKDDFEAAVEIIENEEDYIDISISEDIREYDIMEEFCYSYKDKEISKELCNSINGSGAFRRFKGILYDKGIDDQWYEFRDNKFVEKIIKWCEGNDIEYIDDTK